MRGAVMIAGFPCTPWAKSGKQTGKKHTEGKVFWSLLTMMKSLDSPAFIFENVTNLLGDKHTTVWRQMRRELGKRGYHIGYEKISTRDVGVPQNRNRVFIVGVRAAEGEETINDFFAEEFSQIKDLGTNISTLSSILDEAPTDGHSLSDSHHAALLVWDEYLKWIKEDKEKVLINDLPKPLWGMEAHYRSLYDIEKLQTELDNSDEGALNYDQLIGSLTKVARKKADGLEYEKIVEEFLPPYYRRIARGIGPNYPSRVKFASNSRDHMRLLEEWVTANHDKTTWSDWLARLMDQDPSFQKFEWHLGRDLPNRAWAANEQARLGTRFGNHLVQFRSSGIRVSSKDTFPTLVAIGQVPYTGRPLRQPHWKTLARLQSIPSEHIRVNEELFGTNGEPVRRLGNAVNVRIVEEIGIRLAPYITPYAHA